MKKIAVCVVGCLLVTFTASAEPRGWYCSSFTVDGKSDGSCERDQKQCLEALSNLTNTELKDGKTVHVIGNACAFRPSPLCQRE